VPSYAPPENIKRGIDANLVCCCSVATIDQCNSLCGSYPNSNEPLGTHIEHDEPIYSIANL
jgi:hypothetical protein